MGNERPREDFKGQIFGGFREHAVKAAVTGRQEKSCCIVVPLSNKLSAEQLVPPRVRSLDKLGKHLEMRLCDPNWLSRFGAVLKQKQIAKPWPHRLVKSTFAIGCPQVERGAHGLFGTVVEVITKRGANLRLQLYSRDELTVTDNEEIPFFGWSKETGKFQGLAGEYVFVHDPCVYKQSSDKLAEPHHLVAAGDGATGTLVRSPLFDLFLALLLAGTPIVSNSLRYPFVEIEQLAFHS